MLVVIFCIFFVVSCHKGTGSMTGSQIKRHLRCYLKNNYNLGCLMAGGVYQSYSPCCTGCCGPSPGPGDPSEGPGPGEGPEAGREGLSSSLS